MIILPGTSDILRVVTSAAVATDVQVNWVDVTTTTYGPSRTLTAISTATTTTIVAAPAASTQRTVKQFTICARGGAQTIVLQYFDGTTAFQLIGGTTVSLAIGETLQYIDTEGFSVLDGNGAKKTTGVGAGRLLRAPQYLTSGTSINHPAGTATIKVRGVGGGGAGGGCTAALQGAFGTAGSSGTYGERTFTATASSSTYVVGAGGTGVSANNGNPGAASTFTHASTTVTLPAGLGGIAQAGASSIFGQVGGASPANATNADFSIIGQAGGSGCRPAAVNTFTQCGPGGSNPLGQGAPFTARSTDLATGPVGTGYGSGGGGSHRPASAAAATGGDGQPGVWIVEEYS